jgi:hypothetical protein
MDADADVRSQKAFFHAHRAEFEARYPGQFVAVSAEQVYVSRSLVTAELLALEHNPDRAFYVEGVGSAALVMVPR